MNDPQIENRGHNVNDITLRLLSHKLRIVYLDLVMLPFVRLRDAGDVNGGTSNGTATKRGHIAHKKLSILSWHRD